ncbi:MAG: FliM/FliN family flagellar motor C-terminal domain-containing protein [Candidatus Eremiobacteraeota bacterium]|nr:FliM/FliN family flagellar motor C-terminal domain-containing protein [Candidatus Eremiobacteraeota bacterium]
MEGLARIVDQRARETIRGRLGVQYSIPQRHGYTRLAAVEDRAWHGALDGSELWCVVDTDAQRALLELIIGGPGAPVCTSIERKIVADCMAGLLNASGPSGESLRMREELSARPSANRLWRCSLNLTAPCGPCAVIEVFAPAAAEPPAPRNGTRPDMRPVPISLSATLLPWSIALCDILKWQPGDTVCLPSPSTECTAVVNAGCVRIARARLGSSRGSRALEILEVLEQPGDVAERPLND